MEVGPSSCISRIEEVGLLLERTREEYMHDKSREELVDMVTELSRELLDYVDLTCGPDTAARLFNRKRSWIYEAMSRPNTELQVNLSKVAARESGGLLFRYSDLVYLRSQLFEREV